jgi:hypothetical protein
MFSGGRGAGSNPAGGTSTRLPWGRMAVPPPAPAAELRARSRRRHGRRRPGGGPHAPGLVDAGAGLAGRGAARGRARLLDPVQLGLSAVSVTGAHGQGRASGMPSAGRDAASVSQGLRQPLEPGTYRVAYRVLSADGHPVTGSFEITAVAASGGPAAAVVAPRAPTSDEGEDAVRPSCRSSSAGSSWRVPQACWRAGTPARRGHECRGAGACSADRASRSPSGGRARSCRGRRPGRARRRAARRRRHAGARARGSAGRRSRHRLGGAGPAPAAARSRGDDRRRPARRPAAGPHRRADAGRDRGDHRRGGRLGAARGRLRPRRPVGGGGRPLGAVLGPTLVRARTERR